MSASFFSVIGIWAFMFVSLAQTDGISDAATVRGLVVDSQTHEPIGRALVILSSEGGPSQSVQSDNQGKFEIVNVKPGRYKVTVTRTGYIRLRGDAGSDTLVLGPRQVVRDLRLEMTIPGVVSGVVLSEGGQTRVGVEVVAARPRYEDGKRFLMTCVVPEGQAARTDKNGNYRLYGLEPGEYYILLGDSKSCDVVPQFYPGGTTDPDQAVPVKVSGGSNVRLDLRFRSTQSHSIHFRIVSPSGMIVPGVGFLSHARISVYGSTDLEVRGMRLSSLTPSFQKIGDDRYTIKGLPPGKYAVSYGTDAIFRHVAHFEVNVSDHDVDLGNIVPSLNLTLIGKVSFPGSEGQPRRVRVRLHPADGAFIVRLPQAIVASDGTFTFPSLAGRKYFIEVVDTNTGVYLVSARYAGQEVRDQGIFLDSVPTGPLELIVSDRAGSVEGIVRDSRGSPVGDGQVAIIPTGLRFQNTTLFRSTTIDSTGNFNLLAPPGEYMALAWDYVESGAWQNERFLRSFASQVTRVTVREGQTSLVNLRINSQRP